MGQEAPHLDVHSVSILSHILLCQWSLTNCFRLYLVAFIEQLLQSVQANLVAYITSAFREHALLSVTSILATLLGGVCNLAISKIIDIWGRVEGFTVMLILIVLGMIMEAICTSVQMYAPANTLYWVGHLGMQYVIQIIVADITSLKKSDYRLRNSLIDYSYSQYYV